MALLWERYSSLSQHALVVQNLFFRSAMLTIFVIEHVPGCNFYFRFVQFFSLRKDQMDVVIRLSFVMMQSCNALYPIAFLKEIRKFF